MSKIWNRLSDRRIIQTILIFTLSYIGVSFLYSLFAGTTQTNFFQNIFPGILGGILGLILIRLFEKNIKGIISKLDK